MAPKTVKKVEEEDEEIGQWVVSDFYAELFLKNFPSIKTKHFHTSPFWNDMYRMFVTKTTSNPAYKGFPTSKSYKIHHSGGFPRTTGRDKSDPRLEKMLTDFLETYDDDVSKAVSCYVDNGRCNVASYPFRDSTESFENTPAKNDIDIPTNKVNTSTMNDSNTLAKNDNSYPEQNFIHKPQSVFVPLTDQKVESKSPPLKRKLDRIESELTEMDVKKFRTKVIAAVKIDNERNDFHMTEASLVLNEINNRMVDDKERERLRKELEMEQAFYEYCIQFFKDLTDIKKQRIVKTDSIHQELMNLGDELKLYISKKKDKLKDQHDKEDEEMKQEWEKIFSEI